MQKECVVAIAINVAKIGTLFERHLFIAIFLNCSKAKELFFSQQPISNTFTKVQVVSTMAVHC